MNIVRHPNRHRSVTTSSDLHRAAELAERNERRLIAWHARYAMHQLHNPKAIDRHARHGRACYSRRMTAQPA